MLLRLLDTYAFAYRYTGFLNTYKRLMAEEGASVFASGIGPSLLLAIFLAPRRCVFFSTFVSSRAKNHTSGPRVMWISIGGFVFFGSYEKAKQLLANVL